MFRTKLMAVKIAAVLGGGALGFASFCLHICQYTPISIASSLTSLLLESYTTTTFNLMQFLKCVSLTKAFCVSAHTASSTWNNLSFSFFSLVQSYPSLRLKLVFTFSNSLFCLNLGEMSELLG